MPGTGTTRSRYRWTTPTGIRDCRASGCIWNRDNRRSRLSGIAARRLPPRSPPCPSRRIAPSIRSWSTLTLAVSLGAIFLSPFVMIGQNRAAEFQQLKADHDHRTAPPHRRGTQRGRAVMIAISGGPVRRRPPAGSARPC
ncbi:DUF1003 domain-containing protein [Nocardia beijingensis]|uniref:DUF1003 domain-containing protein n=1 Tax=Nocardia beijingensis TaxID=95162 RepID=UPI0033228A9B